DTLALLVLAVIVGMTSGTVDVQFWLKLSVSIVLFGVIVWITFPIIGRWFFKRFDENIAQYIFVLVMMYLGAVLAEIAGIEGIIGAFLAGLALNRLIPHTSPLMNRIEFVGNAIFIPFFLIGVGMLIDFRAFIKDWETIKVAVFMSVTATAAKYIAAWLTQKTFRFSTDERRLIFGLSNAQAAATLAAVLVGYNIVVGQTPTGEPIRLLSDAVLNGTILMILVTCTIATFSAQQGAKNIALKEQTDDTPEQSQAEAQERILIPMRNPETTEELIQLSLAIKSKTNKHGLYALTVVDSPQTDEVAERNARKILQKATAVAAATDTHMHELLRYDRNVAGGISGIIREHRITDMILGLHEKQALSDSFLGTLTEGILTKNNVTTFIYKSVQPLATVSRYLVVMPQKAEEEIGFALWIKRMFHLGKNTATKLVFYGASEALAYVRNMQQQHLTDCDFVAFTDWEDFLILARDLKPNDGMIIIMSRQNHPSYNESMERIPYYLNKYFRQHNFILIFPVQAGVQEMNEMSTAYPVVSTQPIEKIDKLSKTIRQLFNKISKK
ncbi:MAG: cation:proton antiporter, partial [Flammeovirgaceae bacterium]|nr:cation:proton antiporter [Flammeovirgaceae bacterium]